MKIILKSKTGTMQMGGYFLEKTAQILKYEGQKWFRVSYKGDKADEVFSTIEEADKRYNKLCESIN